MCPSTSLTVWVGPSLFASPFQYPEHSDEMQGQHQLPYAPQRKQADNQAPPLDFLAQHSVRLQTAAITQHLKNAGGQKRKVDSFGVFEELLTYKQRERSSPGFCWTARPRWRRQSRWRRACSRALLLRLETEQTDTGITDPCRGLRITTSLPNKLCRSIPREVFTTKPS